MTTAPCYLCQGQRQGLYAQVEAHRLVQCQECGFIWILGMTPEKVAALYHDDEYHTSKGGSGFEIDGFTETGLNDGWARHFDKYRFQPLLRKMIERRGKLPAHYLDVGCSAGLMLAIAREYGWTVEGIETGARAARAAREKLGLKIQETDLEHASLKNRSFDAISMFHVLEHLIEPRSALIKAREALKDDGLLAVEVPNIESLPAKVRKNDWHGYVLPYHLWHFSLKTLTALLSQSGFRVISSHTPYVPCSIAHIVNVHGALAQTARKAKAALNRVPAHAGPTAASTNAGSRGETNPLVRSHAARLWMERAVRTFYWPGDVIMAKTGQGEVIYVLAEKVP